MVFLCYSVAASEKGLPARVRVNAALSGIGVVVAERGARPRSRVSARNRKAISQASLVVGLVASGGEHDDEVYEELSLALDRGLPTVVLVEQSRVFDAPPGALTIPFDRGTPATAHRATTSAAKAMGGRDWQWLYWLIALIVALLGLNLTEKDAAAV